MAIVTPPSRVSAVEVSERLWERAFQLSYFILMDRSAAGECVARAIEKLAAQQSREKRRTYWRGRKKELTIRRISRPKEDTLQWLICLESEVCEKEQELRGQPTEADMVVRYVKHLAQMTTGSSSFHVNIGFNRLLRNYTTPEVQQIYELATGRFPASEEYRKAKGKLLNQVAARFDRFLRIRTAQYGELQFETHVEHAPWCRLVDECLEFFAPWSSNTSCLRDAGALQFSVPAASRHAGRSHNVPDRLETSRCHWFMHSTCYGRLAEQLGFDAPPERLSVPRFLHRDDGGRGSDPGSAERRTAPLSQRETQVLRERMAAVMATRAIALVPLKIVAHGTVCARLDPAQDERCAFEIPDGTRLLEVWTDTAGSDRIVATHWLDYGSSDDFAAGEYTIALQGGRELALSVIPTSEGQGEDGSRARVTIESRAASTLGERLRSVSSFFGQGRAFWRPALVSVALAAVGVLAGGAYLGFRISQDRLIIGRMAAEVASQKAAISALEQASKRSAQLAAHYAFRSDASNLRGTGSPGEPVVSFASGESMVILELPVVESEHALYRATLSSFPQEQERLSETALRPVKSGNHWVVEFALPAGLVEGDTHYLLALTQVNGADSGHYLFEVRKQ